MKVMLFKLYCLLRKKVRFNVEETHSFFSRKKLNNNIVCSFAFLFFFFKWKTITANNINPNLKKKGEGCNHANTFCCVFFMIYIKRKDWISVQGIKTKIDETWSINSWYDQIMRDAIRKSTFPNGKKNVIPTKKNPEKQLSFCFSTTMLKSKILHK